MRTNLLDDRYAVIVSGGEAGADCWDVEHGTPGAQSLIFGAGTVIAADSGAEYLHSLGTVPSIFVGDFDSCGPDAYEFCKQGGSKIIRLQKDKDDTDTEAAVGIASELGYKQLVLIGGFGGTRFEHSLANFFLIESCRNRGADLVVVSRRSVAFGLSGAEREIYGKAGDWVSLFPITREVSGVSVTGLLFPLSEATLRRGATLGVSNEMLGARAGIGARRGFLGVVLTERRD